MIPLADSPFVRNHLPSAGALVRLVQTQKQVEFGKFHARGIRSDEEFFVLGRGVRLRRAFLPADEVEPDLHAL